jgi:hypothetical protein
MQLGFEGAGDRPELTGWKRSLDKWIVSQYGGSQEDIDKYEVQVRTGYLPNLFELVVALPLIYGMYHLIF